MIHNLAHWSADNFQPLDQAFSTTLLQEIVLFHQSIQLPGQIESHSTDIFQYLFFLVQVKHFADRRADKGIPPIGGTVIPRF